jgi:uncharacterized SAM-binding protein YcdF (DUF218 family)
VKKLDLRRRLSRKDRQRLYKLMLLASLGTLLASLLFNLLVRLPLNASSPQEAIFVLGGSIKREIYAAQLAKQSPNLPILISQGSRDPCIWRIFQQATPRLERVWLEKCANSTFENFFFSVPILRHWRVHKVLLVTSYTHLPRAKWMGQILLGAQGIAVDIHVVGGPDIPGNRESWWKTGLDVTRSLIWAVFSQLIQPPCSQVIQLSAVDMEAWRDRDFVCESSIHAMIFKLSLTHKS